jgi:hypothetical protein
MLSSRIHAGNSNSTHGVTTGTRCRRMARASRCRALDLREMSHCPGGGAKRCVSITSSPSPVIRCRSPERAPDRLGAEGCRARAHGDLAVIKFRAQCGACLAVNVISYFCDLTTATPRSLLISACRHHARRQGLCHHPPQLPHNAPDPGCIQVMDGAGQRARHPQDLPARSGTCRKPARRARSGIPGPAPRSRRESSVSGPDAGVGPIDLAIEADGHDVEPRGGEHRLEQPPAPGSG